jgi:hypothetical protein
MTRGARLVCLLAGRSLWVISWAAVILAVLLSIPGVSFYVGWTLLLLYLLSLAHPWLTAGVATLVAGSAALLCWTVHLDRPNRSDEERLRS